MKKIFFCASFFFLTVNLFFCQDSPLRGPFNQPSNGVIDGVVLKEELPTRLTVPYQSVLLIILFKGSSDFSEEITESKYPEYKAYKERTPRFIPFLKSRKIKSSKGN